jgi:uncharacterized membrane protein YgcG
MTKFYLSFVLVFLNLALKAQKVPEIQSIAMQAPNNLRIDGKANEWNDTFAADNKRTSLLYNLANDDKNLYLVIKAGGSANINKIMAGGITFNVNADGKKREKESLSITYPLIKRAGRGQQGARQGGFQQGQARGNFGGGGQSNRTQQTTAQRDSASLVQHKTQLAAIKEIKIQGFKSITDSLISIYNEYGIKAAASFNDKGEMIYELAVPLSLLEISIDKPKEFAYQLKVNGLIAFGFGGNNGGGDNGGGNNRGGNNFGGGGGGGGRQGGGGFGGNGGGNNMQDLMSPTDFWGKYTLIKK